VRPRRHYVGRAGLQDSRRREVVLDWRAPLARAFYQATASNPMGLVRRRHIDTRRRRVIGLEDEVVDVRSLREGGPAGARAAAEGLQGEGALIAAMSAARHGRMGDIVATIQAEQDRVVTSDTRGVLVVQGGPGTGKTAVALHRVAYLFYSERTRLERSGVLLVGPSRTFLRYVEQVLPSLGETGVVSTTIADLVPGVRARGVEDPRVHEIKGRALWAEVLRRAVRGLQRVPDGPRPIVVEGTALELRPADVREAVNRARRSGRPHNLARETFVLWLLERLTDQFAALTGQDASDPDTRAWIREDIRTARDARREINLCWMPTTPAGLLERLWARPALLAELAPELTGDERALLARPAGGEPTPADVPLIDELAELLGPSEDAQARRARLEARRRAELVSYAAQAIESQELGGGMVSAEMLADRMEDSGPALTLAERARADRTWTYGHVVVDEAQELGAMAWRALARRCPVRSFTVVGDLAQYSGPRAPASWGEALAALGARPAPR
ncbi:MAG: HelD family protein, partial [Actinomyces dentalis]